MLHIIISQKFLFAKTMVPLFYFFLLTAMAVTRVRADYVSVQNSCIEESQEIIVSFEKDGNDNFDDSWIAIYSSDALDNATNLVDGFSDDPDNVTNLVDGFSFSALDNVTSLPDGELWANLCGSQDCDPSTSSSAGLITFGNESQSWNQEWPLLPGTYYAVLSRGDPLEDWLVSAVSEAFEVGCDGNNTQVVEEPTPRPTPGPTLGPTQEPTPKPTPSLNLGAEMMNTIMEARADIEDLISGNSLLPAKFLRLAFHDCVGGCDGCVDMSSPDNAGLGMPIDSLQRVVDEYENRGLSRTDIWMLSAMVASDVSEISVVEFPFQWIGRKTCEEIHGGNDCGTGADGRSLPCNPIAGPRRTFCHGDTAGTRTIEDFMLNEFGFDAQQTAAIMGAHSIGAMRDVNSGFEGRSGWDLTNAELDEGYFIELVGGGNQPPPNWVQVRHNNDRLPEVPSRWQFEARVDGVQLTMLNSDIAMVLDLVEGENLMPDGRITCNFNGNNPCERNTPFLPFVTRYANSRTEFLSDFRDALEVMTENGYTRDTTCGRGEVCLLTSLS